MRIIFYLGIYLPTFSVGVQRLPLAQYREGPVRVVIVITIVPTHTTAIRPTFYEYIQGDSRHR